MNNIDASLFLDKNSFTDKILFGVQKALRKLAEEAAANDESLVVKIDGEIKDVPAKELLKTLPEE
ncbi:hypothetical protein [Parapedobacter tibetensis]|uniref:hypothetical protein n=1 Tax=Parapedobacter tibetensis TaxID=2972951 RepID=UPI00214D5BB4|nr:hypothetical protein [Parapedobacter tibetensis]